MELRYKNLLVIDSVISVYKIVVKHFSSSFDMTLQVTTGVAINNFDCTAMFYL